LYSIPATRNDAILARNDRSRSYFTLGHRRAAVNSPLLRHTEKSWIRPEPVTRLGRDRGVVLDLPEVGGAAEQTKTRALQAEQFVARRGDDLVIQRLYRLKREGFVAIEGKHPHRLRAQRCIQQQAIQYYPGMLVAQKVL
jgi:hypothetical protein